MLEFLVRIFTNPEPIRPTSHSSVADFVQSIAEKLERDVGNLDNKERGVRTFKALFYSHILASLWEHHDCLEQSRQNTEDLLPLSTTLDLLQRLCLWPSLAPTSVASASDASHPNSYPYLRRLVDSESSASPAISAFIKAKSQWDLAALDLWKQLLAESPSSSSDRSKGPAASELKKVARTRVFPDVHSDASKLYDALIQHLSSAGCCYTWPSMIANLDSSTLNGRDVKDDASCGFRLFLTNSHAIEAPQLVYWWQDVHISIEKQKTVHFSEPDTLEAKLNQVVPESIEALQSRMETHDNDALCGLFGSRTLFQHYLLYSSDFRQSAASLPERRFRQDRPSIPLSSLIGFGKLTTKTKIFLSSCLVTATWQLYDSKWISEDWNKEDIHFMLEPIEAGVNVSIQQPFLQTRFPKSQKRKLSDIPRSRKQMHNIRPHRYPRLLALGITLLEIELDQSIESLVQMDYEDHDPINRKHTMAIKILENSQIWPPQEIYSFLKEVIEMCLKPDYDKLEKTDNIRQNFLEEVVQPFNNFVAEAWPKDQVTAPMPLPAQNSKPVVQNLPFVDRRVEQSTDQLRSGTSPTHDEYTVGWITALEVEMAVAYGMLDEVFSPLHQVQGDTNNYILGRLGLHKVVIACLPSMGNNNATLVATNLMRSFQNVRIGLMVGIGGGVPAAGDMRLGDVVVSYPTKTHGGVIQYDFGTATQSAETFVRKGHLNQPPTAILTALKILRAKNMLQDDDYQRHFEDMIEKFPKIGRQCKRPPRDHLYHWHYLHKNQDSDCGHCDNASILVREPRTHTKVHYGTIGSGNEVIRDAVLRDELHEKNDILCFEMEAAGLMNDFPCIVIRGISDYCDSHKSKEWQAFAAGIAAAFAKELLLTISPTQVEATIPASDTIEA